MSMEREYSAVDFSGFSKVKESLRQKLHQERQKAAPAALGRVELGFDDLDCIAAAGMGTPPPNRPSWEKGGN